VDSFATRPATSSQVESAFIDRVPVIGVVLAAACALGAAAVMSGYPMGGPPLAATMVAVVGGVVWMYAPRAGYWVLLVGGVATMASAGVALAQGAVPWLLVAFWGGSALVLAAILHLTAGAGRSSTVTTVAVISLLALSALGLAQYVRATWTSDERAVLEELPQSMAPSLREPVWTVAITAVPDGAWRCAWVTAASPRDTMAALHTALSRDGWRIRSISAGTLSADNGEEQLDITLAENPDGYPGTPESDVAMATRVSATVHEVAPAEAP